MAGSKLLVVSLKKIKATQQNSKGQKSKQVTYRESSPGRLGVFISICTLFLFRFLVTVTPGGLNKTTNV